MPFSTLMSKPQASGQSSAQTEWSVWDGNTEIIAAGGIWDRTLRVDLGFRIWDLATRPLYVGQCVT